jgi:hypothetical protein
MKKAIASAFPVSDQEWSVRDGLSVWRNQLTNDLAYGKPKRGDSLSWSQNAVDRN